MSSIDDLITSLNANHIGQDALELAALQAQLSQALFSHSMASASSFNTPCHNYLNTPVSRTPSTSISLDITETTWARSCGTSQMRNSLDESSCGMDDLDDDEKMVEDILLASPSSPSATLSRSPPLYGHVQSPAFHPGKPSLSLHMAPLDHRHPDLPSPNTSLFTNTDPFYIATLQSSHNHSTSSSMFAQAGRPSTHSPFLKHHLQSMYSSFGHSYQPGPTDNHQPHNLFAATAVPVPHTL